MWGEALPRLPLSKNTGAGPPTVALLFGKAERPRLLRQAAELYAEFHLRRLIQCLLQPATGFSAGASS